MQLITFTVNLAFRFFMSLQITSLNSGSNGNCYYIGNEHEAILVDVGISCRETEKRLKRLHLSIEKVKAIFVSHEHGDHISGISVLSKKYRIPVYITKATLSKARLVLDKDLIFSFIAHQPITIGGLTMIGFPKLHDANDPHSFVISSDAVTVGVFTDIGVVCEQVTHYFKQCNAAILEANYDEEMLENGSYPYHLKKRISGGEGHLSNDQALQLFVNHRPAFMSHLLLGHLSKNNNSPELVKKVFDSHQSDTNIIIASRYHETEVYHITQNGILINIPKKNNGTLNHLQLSLF